MSKERRVCIPEFEIYRNPSIPMIYIHYPKFAKHFDELLGGLFVLNEDTIRDLILKCLEIIPENDITSRSRAFDLMETKFPQFFETIDKCRILL